MKGILFVLYTAIHQWLIQLNIKSASESTAKKQVISDALFTVMIHPPIPS